MRSYCFHKDCPLALIFSLFFGCEVLMFWETHKNASMTSIHIIFFFLAKESEWDFCWEEIFHFINSINNNNIRKICERVRIWNKGGQMYEIWSLAGAQQVHFINIMLCSVYDASIILFKFNCTHTPLKLHTRENIKVTCITSWAESASMTNWCFWTVKKANLIMSAWRKYHKIFPRRRRCSYLAEFVWENPLMYFSYRLLPFT